MSDSTDGWPGQWFSKTPDTTDSEQNSELTFINDNGILSLHGDGPEEYLKVRFDGHDIRTEVRR
jgi:hypothetical protein